MNSWIKRHVSLTREERLLIAGILAIALIGLGARLLRSTPAEPDQAPIPARAAR